MASHAVPAAFSNANCPNPRERDRSDNLELKRRWPQQQMRSRSAQALKGQNLQILQNTCRVAVGNRRRSCQLQPLQHCFPTKESLEGTWRWTFDEHQGKHHWKCGCKRASSSHRWARQSCCDAFPIAKAVEVNAVSWETLDLSESAASESLCWHHHHPHKRQSGEGRTAKMDTPGTPMASQSWSSQGPHEARLSFQGDVLQRSVASWVRHLKSNLERLTVETPYINPWNPATLLPSSESIKPLWSSDSSSLFKNKGEALVEAPWLGLADASGSSHRARLEGCSASSSEDSNSKTVYRLLRKLMALRRQSDRQRFSKCKVSILHTRETC